MGTRFLGAAKLTWVAFEVLTEGAVGDKLVNEDMLPPLVAEALEGHEVTLRDA